MKYPTVKIDGKEIEYFVKGEGKDIIFIHGLGSSLKIWKKTVNKIPNKFRCWAISLPMYKDFKIRRYSELIEIFIEKLKIQNPYIVGSSLGGLISIDLADRNEIGKMVLVSTPLTRITPKGLKMLIDSLDDKINEDESFEELSKWLLSRIPFTRNQLKKISIKSLVNYVRGIVDMNFPFDCSKLKLDEKFILVYGKDDFILKVLHGLDLYEEIGAEKIIVLDSDHFIPTKNPKKLADIIENFFTERPKSSLEDFVEFGVDYLKELLEFVKKNLKI